MRNLSIFLYYLIGKNLPSSFFPLGSLWNSIRLSLLKGFISVGKNTKVQPGVYVGKGRDIRIGSHCQINENVKLHAVDIGDYVMIAPGVTILSRNHQFERTDIPMVMQGEQQEEKVTVERDVWIGTNAVIMPGVRIAEGVIIGAGAVVTKDCEAYGVYLGVPAKKLRSRRED